MTTFFIIAKGNTAEVAKAAEDRGIKFVATNKEVEKNLSAFVETDWATIARWFGEDWATPYPVGTLLFYRDEQMDNIPKGEA